MRSPLLERLSLELPILQAALGGGISSPELAAAVSNAGGMGSIGMRSPAALVRDAERTRALAPGRPFALGLLVPFTRRAHVRAVLDVKPAAVVLMAGFAPALVSQLTAAGVYVLHQVGSRADAERALSDGADALIAQGVEAGGHVLGDQAGDSLLQQLLALAGDKPVVRAGGIANADDVRASMALGAAAVMVGTRYLLTHEARAHSAYKQRILGAERTLLTTLFGVGWSLRHRVVPNRATDRFCDQHGRIPGWARALQLVIEPLVRPWALLHEPQPMAARTFNIVPLFTGHELRPDQSELGLEYTALYAGDSAKRIQRIESAADVTRQLAAGAR